MASYKFDLPRGVYEVELHFADIEISKEHVLYDMMEKSQGNIIKSHQFDIKVNGDIILPGFNPSQFAGSFHAITKRFTFEVANDEGITIDFEDEIYNQAIINGIKIRKKH